MTTIHAGIHEILRPGLIRIGLAGATKDEVLEELIALLAGDERVRDFDAVRRAVLARESMMSTGVGQGLALPHARTDAVSEIVAAFATTAAPVPFDSVDGQPVRLLFLMVSAQKEKTLHVKLLSRVSRLMNDPAFRARLLGAERVEEVIALFEQGERDLL